MKLLTIHSAPYKSNAEATAIIEAIDASDDAIIGGWTYFAEWRKTRNALLLFDVVRKLNVAERAWSGAYPGKPMRREWQVLRRCVMSALERLGKSLIDARTPAQTELAIYKGKKRATLARTDQLNDRAVTIALAGSTIDEAAKTLEEWKMPRSKLYLKKRASQLGLTRRKVSEKPKPSAKGPWRGRPAKSSTTVSIGPGRRRHHGNSY